MKTHFFLIFCFMFLAGSVSAQESKASVALAAAVYQEEVTGNLDKAVEMYLDILKNYPNDRPVAAKALYHLGLVNEKMGKQKASEYFTKLVNTYPDQAEIVAKAKARLAALASPSDEKGFVARRILADASEVDGKLTRDGKYINRMDRMTGDVVQFDVTSGQTRRIKNTGPYDEFERPVERQVFSQDGKQIVYDRFTKENAPELRVRNLDGSGLRTLYNKKGSYVFPLDWSPDAGYVLATIGEYTQLKELVLISINDGSVRVLKKIASGPYMLNSSDFSPDGRFIAFSMVRDGNPPHGDLFIVDVKSLNESIIADHPAEDELIAWTPDGKSLLFLSDRSGTWDIWAVRVDAGKQYGEPVLIKKNFGRDSWVLGLTLDGALYYRFNTPLGGLFSGSIDSETGKVLSLPSAVPTRYNSPPFNLSWSPDGKYLLYLSNRGTFSSGYNIITIRSAETGEEHFLAPHLRFVFDINWSPDSRSIIAYGITAKEIGNFRIDPETSKATKLEVTGRIPRLCPDGKTLLYINVEETEGASIKKHNTETNEESVIAKIDGVSYDISPNGQNIVCYEDSNVKICPLDGGESKVLVSGLAKYYSLRWTGDGKNIIARNLDNNEIWIIPLQGGTARKMDLSVPSMIFFALSPDSRRFFYSTREGYKSELWLMENFLPK